MIKTDNLCMNYGPVTALDHVSFEVKQGEVIGLLGPNGAGKSTTLKIITTYIYPTNGSVYVDGKDVCQDSMAVRKKIGYLPENLPLYMDMEVEEYLIFVGKSRGIYGKELQDRLNWVKEECGIKPVFKKVIRQLSKGYKQRTALAQALIHDPEIVILDEPTSGLDPHQILEIRALIKRLAKKKTIIFSTHILQEVQAITDRIIIINRGKIVADGTIEKLEKSLSYQVSEIVLPSEIKEKDVTKILSSVDGVNSVKTNKTGNKITYTIQADQDATFQERVTKIVRENNWPFLEVKKKVLSLEDIFLSLTKPEIYKKGGK